MHKAESPVFKSEKQKPDGTRSYIKVEHTKTGATNGNPKAGGIYTVTPVVDDTECWPAKHSFVWVEDATGDEISREQVIYHMQCLIAGINAGLRAAAWERPHNLTAYLDIE